MLFAYLYWRRSQCLGRTGNSRFGTNQSLERKHIKTDSDQWITNSNHLRCIFRNYSLKAKSIFVGLESRAVLKVAGAIFFIWPFFAVFVAGIFFVFLLLKKKKWFLLSENKNLIYKNVRKNIIDQKFYILKIHGTDLPHSNQIFSGRNNF